MRCVALLIVTALVASASGDANQPRVVRYGNYYSLQGESKTLDYEASTYYLYSPKKADATQKLPVIVHFHGGGFTGGKAYSSSTQEIEMYLQNGFHYLSADYRLVGTKYYFTNHHGEGQEEEFIHAAANGNLTLNTEGKAMSTYKVRIGRQEFNTKCSFDAAAVMEHLLAHADEYGVDVHRMGLTGDSAGGGEIQYLIWVYHALGNNAARYTPRSMVYEMAQLDYTVQNVLDRVWSIWAEAVGSDTKLSTILSQRDCYMIVGNPQCQNAGKYQTDLCNTTWNDESMSRFCGNGFDTVTISQLAEAQKWPMETEQDKGIATLWYNSVNMQRHQPRPFYLYVANWLNGTEGMNLVHNAVYARGFARAAKQAGINYTCYWTDYVGMKEGDRSKRRFEVDEHRGKASGVTVYNYESSVDFVDRHAVATVPRVSLQEQLLHHCMAMDKHDCNATLPPSPSPAPPSPMPASCDEELSKECPNRSSPLCQQCVRGHAPQLVGAGCPRGPRAGQEVIRYWCDAKAEGSATKEVLVV